MVCMSEGRRTPCALVWYPQLVVTTSKAATPIAICKRVRSPAITAPCLADEQLSCSLHTPQRSVRQSVDCLKQPKSRIPSHFVNRPAQTLVSAPDPRRSHCWETLPLPAICLHVHQKERPSILLFVPAAPAQCTARTRARGR